MEQWKLATVMGAVALGGVAVGGWLLGVDRARAQEIRPSVSVSPRAKRAST
jgi:hypothetical protein